MSDPTFVYVCTNADCPELDVPKSSAVAFDPPPICGECGQPTTPAAPAPRDRPGP